jgi:hypothetical protein
MLATKFSVKADNNKLHASKATTNLCADRNNEKRVLKNCPQNQRIIELASPNVNRVKSKLNRFKKRSQFNMIQAEKFANILRKKSSCIVNHRRMNLRKAQAEKQKLQQMAEEMLKNIHIHKIVDHLNAKSRVTPKLRMKSMTMVAIDYHD